MLLPQGLLPGPYEILDYQATLVLHDPKGIRATFERLEQIRFLQDGVSAILDHAWGDGVVTSYHNGAGSLEESFRDEGCRHLVIGLKRPRGRGEILTFAVTRTAMVAFTKNEEWLETTLDHPVLQLVRSVIFPKERPCLSASLDYQDQQVPLPITGLEGGRSMVRFELPEAHPFVPYFLRWIW